MHTPIPYHHLYDIHILVLISFRAVDVFGSCFHSPFHVCHLLSYLYYFTTLLYHSLVLELGRRLRCRGQTAQALRVFFSFLHICFVLYLYGFILNSMLRTPFPPTPRPIPKPLLVFYSSSISSPVLVRPLPQLN